MCKGFLDCLAKLRTLLRCAESRHGNPKMGISTNTCFILVSTPHLAPQDDCVPGIPMPYHPQGPCFVVTHGVDNFSHAQFCTKLKHCGAYAYHPLPMLTDPPCQWNPPVRKKKYGPPSQWNPPFERRIIPARIFHQNNTKVALFAGLRDSTVACDGHTTVLWT